MFDFDGLEDDDAEPSPSPSVEELVEQALAALNDERFTVRRDACKSLAAIGIPAAKCAETLGNFLATEEDYEVQKAAVAALKSMREGGVQPLQSLRTHHDPGMKKIIEKALQELEQSGIEILDQTVPHVETNSNSRPTRKVKREDMHEYTSQPRREVPAPPARKTARDYQVDVVEPKAHDASIEYPWPCVLFRIFRDVLPMRVERHNMTPRELIHIWEHDWRVPYASRIKFLAAEDAGKKYLHPQDDIVPGSPCDVQLHAGVGSILESLAVALKRYGRMDLQEFYSEKQELEQKKAVAAEVRKRDDAREIQHWQELEIQRERRMATPEDAERRRLLRIRETTPWRLNANAPTPSTSQPGPRLVTPYS
jgi:hypothetical protein